MQPVVPAAALRTRVATRLRLAGSPHAAVAAALLQSRGLAGADVVTFAHQLGVDPDVLRSAERGEVAPALLPAPLRRLLDDP